MVLEYLSACAIEGWMNTDSVENMDIMGGVTIVGTVIAILISLATAYLASVCNKHSNIVVRMVVTVLAFVFSGMYLLYYLLVHVIFGEQCEGRKLNLFKHGKSIFKGRKTVKKKKKKSKKSKKSKKKR